MANITITFPNPLAVGISINDVAWYIDSSTDAEVMMGPILSITGSTIVVNASAGVNPPTVNDFVFYAQEVMATVGALKGYYAEAQFTNNSTAYGELFSIGAEIFESSK
jgi:hypothetical protein